MLTLIADKGLGWAEYRCECGKTKVLLKSNANRGTKSCGCLRRRATAERSTTHGHKAGGKRSRAYVAWMNMKARCLKPATRGYENYGGRGIKVCDRWKDSFGNFLADMGEPPAGKSLDRYPDTNGNYEPGNCRWADRGQQNSNKRSNHRVEAFGKSLTIAEWSRETGVGTVTIIKRLHRGVPAEQAVAAKGYLKCNRT